MPQTIQKNFDSFLRVNVKNHMDEWIAIVNGEIVACGKNLKEVYEKAKKTHPTERPLITKIPSKKAMILLFDAM